MPGVRLSRSGSDTGTSVHSPDRKGAPPHKPFGGRGRDALVRPGGAPRIGIDASAMGRNGEYIDRAEVPILGICAGHQFMALHLGGDAKAAKVPEFGKTRLVVDAENALFEGLPREFAGWEGHNDEVAG